MAHPRLSAEARDKRIALLRQAADVDSRGHATISPALALLGKPWACLEFGSGGEQRIAAQDEGRQTVSFNLLRDSVTIALRLTDKIGYPLVGDVPEHWPVWDINAIAELGFNEGFRITATKVAP